MSTERAVPRAPTDCIYPEPMPTGATTAAAITTELRRRLPDLPQVKLQKLLYYCQGHHLGWGEAPLFSEVIKAYEMGPVVPQIWGAEKAGAVIHDDQQLDNTVLGTVSYVVENYGHLRGKDLINLTHDEAPWKEAWASKLAGGSDVISVESIAKHFRGIYPPLRAETTEWLAAAGARLRAVPPRVDDLDRLRARLAEGV